MPIAKKSNYEPPENAYRGPGGTYVATLTAIGEMRTTEEVWEGKKRTRNVEEWAFTIDSGEHAGMMVWNSWVTAFDYESNAISERSKAYGYAAALVGGSTNLDALLGQVDDLEQLRDRQLIGRQAIITVAVNEEGRHKIETVSAMPTMAPAPAPAPEPAQQPTAVAAPVNGTVQPQPQPAPPAAVQQAPAPQQAAAEDLSGGMPF